MAENDVTLIQATLAGNKQSLERLVRKYQRLVFALALERVREAAAAEDVTQDVFVRVHQKLHLLKDARRFAGWLRSITLNQCKMWLRAKRRERSRQISLQGSASSCLPVGESPSRADENVLNIAAMILELPSGLRSAAVLCFERDLSPRDAALALGLKPGTLRKRLHDARAALQRKIVEKAEAQLQMGFLPRGFAHRCVCRCARAQQAKERKEVKTMAEKKNCGCGCASKRGSQANPKAGAKSKK